MTQKEEEKSRKSSCRTNKVLSLKVSLSHPLLDPIDLSGRNCVAYIFFSVKEHVNMTLFLAWT
jgi:hypothetical protein